MTETTTVPDCLLCAVRTLTEGRPREWTMRNDMAEGDTITGVVMVAGSQPSYWAGEVPFVDLWLGGYERTRVAGHSSLLASLMADADAKVGDTFTIRFDGTRPITSGNLKGSSYKSFTVTVARGHH